MLSRKILFLTLCLLSLVFCGKELVLSGVGLCAKGYFHWFRGISLQYDDVLWKAKGFVFTDIVLNKSGEFSCSVPQVIVSLQNRHVQLFSPQITLEQIPKWDAGTSVDWKVSVQEGILITPQKKKVSCSCEYDLSLGIGSAFFSLDAAWVKVRLDSGAIDIECEQFPLSILSSLENPLWSGTLEGTLHLMQRDSRWLLQTGFLEAEELGYSDWIEGICGTIYWDGPLYLDGNHVEWTSMLDEGRCRVSVYQGDLKDALDKTMIHGLQGSLSFDGKAGAKWQLSCMHGKQKLEGEGKGFFYSLKECWIESEFRSAKTVIGVRGKEEEQNFIWEIDVKNLTPDIASWLQEGALFFDALDVPFSMTQGSIHGLCQIVCANNCVEWKLKEAFLDRVSLCCDRIKFSCHSCSLSQDVYLVQGAEWALDNQIIGVNWEGQGKIQNLQTFSGTFKGNVGDLSLSCGVEGHGKSARMQLQCEGNVEGAIFLQAQWEDGGIDFTAHDGQGSIGSWFEVERLKTQGRIDSSGISCFDTRGSCFCSHSGKRVPFYIPIFQTEGKFDVRLEHPYFELARCVGTVRTGEILFDSKKSHVLGAKLGSASCSFSSLGVEKLEIEWIFPWKIASFFLDLPLSFQEVAGDELLSCSLKYNPIEGPQAIFTSNLLYEGEKIPFSLHSRFHEASLLLDPLCIGECKVEGKLDIGKEGVRCTEGRGSWGKDLEFEFGSRFASFNNWSLHLASFRGNIEKILPVKGIVEGKGIISWKGDWESDFDLDVSSIQWGDWTVETRGPLHLFCSPSKGLLIRGLNLFASHPSLAEEVCDCKIGLFHYDITQGTFSLNESQFLAPAGWGSLVPLSPFFQDPKLLHAFELCTLRGLGNFTISTDFTKASCAIREMEVGWINEIYRIQNGSIDLETNFCKIDLEVEHHSLIVPIGLELRLPSGFLETKGSGETSSLVTGCLTVDRGLFVNWTYQDSLSLQSIEGACRGLSASFRLEGDSLIGNARINGNEFRTLLPEKIAQVFHELKIGDGYELMGRVAWNSHGLCFQGMMSGKEAELFGFQIRNILGKIRWDEDHLHISHLTLSDFAGSLKVDEISAMGVGEAPWTLSIPLITVTELRPSLLRNVGSPLGKMNPLVVRELKIYDFQGFVDDGKTYTAHGELYFINSYKRGKSILELPSDLFSRILGLDLDLLVPVCGTLKYQLKDGFFHFTDLEGAYSENQRSEFFLLANDDSPKMDLDWNLHILIQMKQFVLFKFTEAFIISVTGKLDDPKFNLQRKNSGPPKATPVFETDVH